MPVPPVSPAQQRRTGQLFEVKSGSRTAVVAEAGATLFQVNWDGVELLNTVNDDGYGGAGGHGQILVPWPGRIAGGLYSFDGESYQLPVDDYAKQAALHGFARWLSWSPKDHAGGRLTMATRMLARPGYPFCFDLEQSYTWTADSLVVAFSATNTGTGTAPFGYGCHPYFTVGLPTVDQGVLHIPADHYLETDQALNPLGPPKPVEGTSFDFRKPRPVGPAHLDVTFAGLLRGDDGNVAVSFSSPADGAKITCTYGPAVNYVQVYSGDTLPAEFQRQGLAIEPYTCAPNAFNNGLGLLRVPPEGSVRVEWAISAS